MEEETNRQMQAPPPAAVSVAGERETRRARKRSRYLSPPYTHDTDEVCAADVLSALRAAALPDLDPRNPDAAQALRFLALYRRRNAHSAEDQEPLSPAPPTAAAAVGTKEEEPLLSCSTGPPHGSPAAAGSGLAKKKNNKENAAALDEAGHNKRAFQSHVCNATADFAAAATSGIADSAPSSRRRRRRNMNKMMMNNTGQEHFANPVALVLDFAEAAPLPSKDHLLSTFRRFGFVIHSETAIVKDHHRISARVVFATRDEAEAAYSCAETLGTFGPPVATPRLQDLPPITLNPPVPKLPLTDIRKNLHRMISSLTRRPSSFNSPQEAGLPMGNLVGEMQGLLAKVDKMLQGASSAVHHH